MPIRRRVLTVVLLTTLIGILAASITGFLCINWVKSTSEDALTHQLEDNLKSIVTQKAVLADAKLEHYEKYIEFTTDYIEKMYGDEERMIELGRVFYPPTDTKEYMLTRGFASEDLNADDLMDEMLFFSNVEQVWEPIAKANEDLISTVYAGTRRGLLASYDRWSYLSVPDEGKELVYDYFQSDWYKQGLNETDVFYTGLYVDSQGRGLTITVASPFRNASGEIVGVDCADFDITGLYNELLSIDLGDGTYSFALDKDGALISPDSEGMSVEEYTGLTSAEIEELKADSDGIVETKDAVYVRIPIERVGWTLCACVPLEVVQDSISEVDRSIQYAYAVLVGIVILILIIEVFIARKAASSITYPMELLVRDMKIIADGNLGYRAPVYRNDEIGDITAGMNEMVDRLNVTMNELSSTQQHADAMSRLATRDSLTGVRNKTAYDRYVETLEKERAFGLVMIDLNNLKGTNDVFGHEKGDIAIKTLNQIICETFAHSPVFRVGGDEFVVVLKGRDYHNIEVLAARFKGKIEAISKDDQLDPWERVSAAIGYALYDEKLDANVESVLARADREMYEHKRAVKQVES